MIDEAQKAKWDNYAIKQAAIDSGEDRASRRIAKKMKAKNKPVDEIVEFTGLTEEEVKAL